MIYGFPTECSLAFLGSLAAMAAILFYNSEVITEFCCYKCSCARHLLHHNFGITHVTNRARTVDYEDHMTTMLGRCKEGIITQHVICVVFL